MKYQHFSEKLMVLDREEEAKRFMLGNANNQGYGGNQGAERDYYAGGPGGYDGNAGAVGAPSNHDMGEIQPKARKMAAAKKAEEDEDNWGNVDALLEE